MTQSRGKYPKRLRPLSETEGALYRADPYREKSLGIKDYVVCRECCHPLHYRLIGHLQKVHGLTLKTYRANWPEAPTSTPDGRRKGAETQRRLLSRKAPRELKAQWREESRKRREREQKTLAEAKRVLASVIPFPATPVAKVSHPRLGTADKIELAGRLKAEGYSQSSMRFLLFPDQRNTPETAYVNTRRLFCDYREQIETAKSRHLANKQSPMTDVS